MLNIIKYTDSDFDKKITELSSFEEGDNNAVQSIVTQIIDNVKQNGDSAIIEYTNRFDRLNINDATTLKVNESEINQAYDICDADVKSALEFAKTRIVEYHKKQMPADFRYTDSAGVKLGNIWRAIETAGIYVPGGLASYPSSVLMNALPAKVAGVKNIIMTVPTPDGNINPSILAAAKIAGVNQIYKIGGAQAIAALAYGTQTIPRVDKIAGPGNSYVACAKKILFGTVGIDMVAGPSEILVVADSNNNPDWIAADLLSQAEHDKDARSILLTDNEDFANKVIKSVEETLKNLLRKDIAQTSWHNNGAVIIIDDIKNAPTIIDNIAPEHLELTIDNAENMIEKINNAGAIFMGRYTPEAIGDYAAGPSHVLPTAATARFSSGLSVYDFLKRISLIGCDKSSFTKLAQNTKILAENEGLDAHALSIKVRQDEQ